MFAKTKSTLIFATMLLSLILSACSAPVEAVQTITPFPFTPTPQPASIEQTLDEYINSNLFPTINQSLSDFSGSILIARSGNILISKGYGMADLESELPNTPQTIFRIGSITKQFTAMAIMILQEEGKLDVQDLVCEYLSNCPENWQQITIHHLLTHSSGIPDYIHLSDFEFEKKYSVNEIIDTFIDMPLRFPPGVGFRYSNSGYFVLGLIIEQSSGANSYAEYLEENIFQPLNMFNTGYEQSNQILENRASGYVRSENDSLRDADYIEASNGFSAGALYSTVEDLYLWDQALYTEALVSEASLELMFTPHILDYGYGWFSTQIAGRTAIAHNGSIDGFSAEITRFVEDDTVIIVLSNIQNVGTRIITWALAAFIF